MSIGDYNEAQINAQQEFCYAERLKGHTFRAIGEACEAKFGYTLAHKTVAKRIRDELAANPIPELEEVRKMELDRLDRLETIVMSKEQDDPLAAVDRYLKIAESRRKLMGADAPAKQEVAVVAVDATSTYLGELLARTREQNRAVEAQIIEIEALDEN